MLIRLFQQTTMGPTAHSGLTPRYGAELKQPDKQESSNKHRSDRSSPKALKAV